jgi:hypothetical protein
VPVNAQAKGIIDPNSRPNIGPMSELGNRYSPTTIAAAVKENESTLDQKKVSGFSRL